MDVYCCLCLDQLPADRRRRKKLHGLSCAEAKAVICELSAVPLQNIDGLRGPNVILCNNCEKKLKSISDFQTKLDSLKKYISEKLSALLHTSRKRPSASPTPVPEFGGLLQAKQMRIDTGTPPAEVLTSEQTCTSANLETFSIQESPELKVYI